MFGSMLKELNEIGIIIGNSNESLKLIGSTRRDYESLQTEMTRQAKENESAKEKVKEVLQALEELAVNYDQKTEEVDRKTKENESTKEEMNEVLHALVKLAFNYDQKTEEVDRKTKENEATLEELNQKQGSLNSANSELQTLRDSQLHQKKRITEMFGSMLKEPNEIGTIIGSSNESLKLGENEGKAEEEFTVARLYISKMKSEVKNMVQKVVSMESVTGDLKKQIELQEKDLQEHRLLVTQHEGRVKNLSQEMKDVETKKRTLEEQGDALGEEVARLKAVSQVAPGDSGQAKEALEKQIKEHTEQHHKQISALRDELTEKQSSISELKDENQRLTVTAEQVRSDYERLKSEVAEKSDRLNDMETVQERKDQARQDLKGLEETVAKELQTLHNLRKLFVQDLQARVKKAGTGEETDEAGGSMAQKQKIQFLENNLDQLSKVHKQLVRDNADLRCELPKQEKRLRATMERVKALETALKEAKEGAMKDRKRYQLEVDRIKEAVRQKNLARRTAAAQIVRGCTLPRGSTCLPPTGGAWGIEQPRR